MLIIKPLVNHQELRCSVKGINVLTRQYLLVTVNYRKLLIPHWGLDSHDLIQSQVLPKGLQPSSTQEFWITDSIYELWAGHIIRSNT